jgi:hypothetical protein
MKTDKIIKAEITKLKKMKPNVRHYDAFGGNNWDVIDAQLTALERRYDRDEAYDNFPTEYDDQEPRELNGALEAIDWMTDEAGSETPSDGWSTLVVK